MDTGTTQRMREFGADIPFVHTLGFRLARAEHGESELHYEAQPGHLNSFGVTHGGASMTLLDVTMAIAARICVYTNGELTVESL